MGSFAYSLMEKLWYLPIEFKFNHDDIPYLARAVTQYTKKGPLEAQYLLPIGPSGSTRWTTSQLCRLVNQEKGAKVFHIIIKRSKETVERITCGLPSRATISLERMLESSPIMEDPIPTMEDPAPIMEARPRRKRRRITPPVTQRNLRQRQRR